MNGDRDLITSQEFCHCERSEAIRHAVSLRGAAPSVCSGQAAQIPPRFLAEFTLNGVKCSE